jgi:hypothetical protein
VFIEISAEAVFAAPSGWIITLLEWIENAE